MKQQNSKSKSLAAKISTMLLGIIIVCTLVIGTISVVLYRSDSLDTNAHEALSIASAVAASIDSRQFQKILASGEKNDYWHTEKSFVDEVKTKTGVAYLYVLEKTNQNTVRYFVSGAKPGDTGISDLWDEDPVEYFDDKMYETLSTGKETVSNVYSIEGYGQLISGFAPIIDANNKTIGVVGVDLAVSHVMSASKSFALKMILCALFFSVGFGSLFRWYINHKIGMPIRSIANVADRIAQGDMEMELAGSSRDEIGQLTASFQKMIISTRQQIATLEALADGDLTADVDVRSEKDKMGHAMKRTVNNLSTMFSKINTSAAEVAAGANQIAGAAQMLSQSTLQQSSSVEQLGSSISSIAQKAQGNARMASQASALADTIKGNAENGSAQMDRMMQAVREVNEASHSINKVIKVIDDIAFQTNILALNAAVEAARAGQHGKGFAVVADEVRNLAAKSAEAAKETNTLIANSIEKAELGAVIADETAQVLSEIVSGINESSQIINQIAHASNEQNQAIGNINSDIDHVAQGVQQSSATVQESAASSQQLDGQAYILRSLVSKFKLPDRLEIYEETLF